MLSWQVTFHSALTFQLYDRPHIYLPIGQQISAYAQLLIPQNLLVHSSTLYYFVFQDFISDNPCHEISIVSILLASYIHSSTLYYFVLQDFISDNPCHEISIVSILLASHIHSSITRHYVGYLLFPDTIYYRHHVVSFTKST